MSSIASSSSSAATPSQLIDEILKTKADKPDFDLSRLVKQIEVLLAHYEARVRSKDPIGEKVGELPSAIEASNLADQVSTNVKLIANEIKEYSGKEHQTSIGVLNAVGNVHWTAVGFLVVGAALKIADTIKNNKEECLRLFKSMIDLSKVILQLHELPDLKMELHNTLKESIHLIVNGAILCCSQKKRKRFKRIFKASWDAQNLRQVSKDIDEMCKMLHLQISTSTLKSVASLISLVSHSPLLTLSSNWAVSPPTIPTLNHDPGKTSSATEAFLDILPFSYWQWKLQGALIKRDDGQTKNHDLIPAASYNKSKHNRFESAEAFSLASKDEEVCEQARKNEDLQKVVEDHLKGNMAAGSSKGSTSSTGAKCGDSCGVANNPFKELDVSKMDTFDDCPISSFPEWWLRKCMKYTIQAFAEKLEVIMD